MSIAYVGLGSNLEGPLAQLARARVALQQLPQTTLLRHSSYYLTRPLGVVGLGPQPDFINAVAALETTLGPGRLLAGLLEIEAQQGRVRSEVRWGPRTLDLDLLLYDAKQLHEPDLVLPHPQMSRRNFVLRPLLEIAPDLVIPGYGPARALLEKAGHAGLEVVEQGVAKTA